MTEFTGPLEMEMLISNFQEDLFNAMAASVQAHTEDDASGIMAVAAAFALLRWLDTRCITGDRKTLREAVQSVLSTPFASNQEDSNAEQGNPAG